MKARYTYLFFLLNLTYLMQGQDILQASFGSLRARSIGPAVMSGRISCIDGVHNKPEIFYIGAANGGVWKTTSAGAQFEPVFDEYIQSIGDLQIDQAHPDTVWVGTGEPWVRNSVSIGAGVYVTKNGGKTWSFKGLKETERIAKVLIHPTMPNIIYIAAQGPLWNAHKERGVYKTTDFGTTWEKILYVDENTGCADLSMDPTNPDVLLASMWDHRRSPDFFQSGGPGSGLYKTVDGGKDWTLVKEGLPSGDLGRMAVEFAPSQPQRIYLTVEAKEKEDKGLYRSDDGGKSFTRINGDFGNTVRPFYFSRLTVDPSDADKVYKCGLNLTVSDDGGTSFRTVGSGVHSDIHDVWVPASQSKYVVIGTDGGGYRSLDGGYNFEMFMNLPLSQFYHISVDDQEPFHIYGGLQDNGSWYGPSQSAGGIQNADWELSNWGDGFYSFRHPTDPNIIYSESQGGFLIRFDKRDGQSKDIQPLPEEGEPKYRYNWNTPIHLSPTLPERLYVGSQFLLKSENRGDSWERISPDLTTNNPERQRQKTSGGLSIDNSGAENNTTIYTISESPMDPQVVWVGTDDGNLQVTDNGGQTWHNMVKNIPELPPNTWCSKVTASPHDRNTAFVTFDGHRHGDMRVYVFKTEDLGKTWQSLVTDPLDGYAHTIIQDQKNSNLLFLGTEFGLFISLDDGKSWKRFTNNLPGVAVRALAIQSRENALVIGTHGRGVYIIDNITSLRQINSDIIAQTLHFFDEPASIIRLPRTGRPFGGAGNFVGQNPSLSAMISYYMSKRHTFGKMSLAVYDENGSLVKELPPGKSGGINIVQLPLRLPPPKAAPTKNRRALAGSIITPTLLEGKYTVKITKGKDVYTHTITLAPDPESIYTASDRILSQETLGQLYTMTEELGHMYYAMEDMHKGAGSLELEDEDLSVKIKRFGEDVEKYKSSLVALEGDFYVDSGEALREEISELYLRVSSFPGKPSDRQLKKTAELRDKMEKVKSQFSSFSMEAKKLNEMILQAKGKPILWKSFKEYKKA